MNSEIIASLLKALELSPNNTELKLQIAKLQIEEGMHEDAENQLTEILAIQRDHQEAKYHLAVVYFEQEKFSAAEIVLEEVAENTRSVNVLELLCNIYLKQYEFGKARDTYQQILGILPRYQNAEFDRILRQASAQPEEDLIDEDALKFLQKPNVGFKDIGGMEKVKEEISLKIIKPLEHAELYKAYGKKIGGGILLYGPPGCGKTHIARATAGEINANFINVSINDILDMWIGNSERNLHEIFELARKNTPCVIFFDEVDALGANRSDVNKTSGRTIIHQFLSELDGLQSDNEGILVLGATNAPWHLDSAFRRPGRFDRIIFVSPPDEGARESIFSIALDGKPTEDLNYNSFAKKSEKFSGADIKACVDIAIEKKLTESFKDGIPKPLNNKDILRAIKKIKPSTKEWFSSARNYALYSNNSGLYDEVLSYLKIQK